MAHVAMKPNVKNRYTHMVKIANDTDIMLEDGQKVLICQTRPGDIIVSQRTGVKMGEREHVMSAGIVKKVNGKLYVKTEKPVPIVTVGLRDHEKQHRFFSRKRSHKVSTIYAKIVEE